MSTQEPWDDHPGWSNSSGAGGGGTAGSSQLSALTDVAVTSPANTQVLTYDSASGKWKNATPAAGGVTSFNTRTGAVTLAKADVTGTGLAAADVNAVAVGAAAGGDLTGTYPNPTVNSAPIASKAMLGLGYGVTGGTPNNPYPIAPTLGPNLWATANFSTNTNGAPTGNVNNTSTLTPTLTGNGTTQAVTTRIALPTSGGVPTNKYRLTFTVTTTAVTDGSFNGISLNIAPRLSTGTVHQFYDRRLRVVNSSAQQVVKVTQGDTALTSHRFVMEIDLNADQSTTTTYLDLYMVAPNSTTAGSMTLSNVSVYKIPSLTPTINLSWDRAVASGAHIFVDTPLGLDGGNNFRFCRYDFGPDSTLPVGLIGATVYYDAAYGGADRMKVTSTISAGYLFTGMLQNNSDLIIGVVKGDGVTTELRGNTHGGETGQSGTFTTDFQVFADYGDGAGWTQITAYDVYWNPCFRVKIVANTAFTRSDQAGTPFMLATKTFYIYPDGTIRKDQTATFQQAQAVDHLIWHMMSIAPNAYGVSTGNAHAYRGKIGRGQQVLAATDFTARLAVPVATAPSTATTGGTIPGNMTYAVRITAVSQDGGETTPSFIFPTISVPNGTNTNTITANWSAVTNAASYNVYFGLLGMERKVANVAAGTLTYTILGSEVGTTPLPTYNTAVTGTTSDLIGSTLADWTAYYDPASGACIGMALDHTAVASLTGAVAVRADLQRQDNSLQKNYWHVHFSGNDLPQTMANGTVWSGTVWYFVYLPQDAANFEREQTVRGTAAAQLTTVYPT